MTERRLYAAALAAIALIHLGAIWFLPVLPAQDLPQHLAYARIFQDPSAPSFAIYEMPTDMQPYFVTHMVLAKIAQACGLLSALRLVLSAYVIALLGALHLLAAWAFDRSPPWPVLLSAVLVWNPIAAMGFLPFLLCIPLFVLGVALLLRRSSGWPIQLMVVGVAALLASLHVVAAASLVAFATVHALVGVSRRRIVEALLALVGSGAMAAVWHARGALGIGTQRFFDADAIRRAHGLEFVNDWFRIDWSSLPVQINYALWSTLGPFRASGQFLVAAAFGLVAACARGKAGPAPHRRTVVAFALLAGSAPFGLQAPSEVTFVNLRLLTLAATIAIPLVDPRRFDRPAARLAVIVASLAISVHFAVRTSRFAHEASPTLTLLQDARGGGVLSALAFGGRSREFGKQFRVRHFLPMYFTAFYGGVSTQFWARYTDHLPIGYRPGLSLAGPDDWHPEKLEPAQLRDSRWVLLQGCDPDDDARSTCEGEARARQSLGPPLRCHGSVCIYERSQPSAGWAIF